MTNENKKKKKNIENDMRIHLIKMHFMKILLCGKHFSTHSDGNKANRMAVIIFYFCGLNLREYIIFNAFN